MVRDHVWQRGQRYPHILKSPLYSDCILEITRVLTFENVRVGKPYLSDASSNAGSIDDEAFVDAQRLRQVLSLLLSLLQSVAQVSNETYECLLCP